MILWRVEKCREEVAERRGRRSLRKLGRNDSVLVITQCCHFDRREPSESEVNAVEKSLRLLSLYG